MLEGVESLKEGQRNRGFRSCATWRVIVNIFALLLWNRKAIVEYTAELELSAPYFLKRLSSFSVRCLLQVSKAGSKWYVVVEVLVGFGFWLYFKWFPVGWVHGVRSQTVEPEDEMTKLPLNEMMEMLGESSWRKEQEFTSGHKLHIMCVSPPWKEQIGSGTSVGWSRLRSDIPLPCSFPDLAL